MRTAFKVAFSALFCGVVALAVVAGFYFADTRRLPASHPSEPRTAESPASASDLNAKKVSTESQKPQGIFLDLEPLEDGGIAFAQMYTGPIRNPQSLTELRDAIQVRGTLGLKLMKAELNQLHISPQSTSEQRLYALNIKKMIGQLCMYEGKFDEAAAAIDDALKDAQSADVPWKLLAELRAIRGVIALRQGEVSNCIACVGPSSCIFPIAPEAAHQQQAGSRAAIKHFTTYLDELPGDLRIQWLLNIAYMTLGEYPDKVPAKYLMPIDSFRSKIEVGKFSNVATAAGLTTRGPNMAGGSIFDDFTGDGLPDVFSTSLDADRGASLFVNMGDGTFSDHSHKAGLDDQVYVLNLARGDYDNDGNLDLFLLRGAWDKPMRCTLLRNKGDGTFEDVTAKAGVSEPISSESAAWGDYDNDGKLDLFLCGEFVPPDGADASYKSDPRNRCRLYHNEGDGTFKDVASAAGVENFHCAKGAAWGDYDNDGELDLFVSNMDGPSRLYHNEGNGTFKDMAPSLDVTADHGFACWFWDYDNDGKLDLFVNGKGVSLAEEVAIAIRKPINRSMPPRLYHNLGVKGFHDVSAEVGLDRSTTPMGCNFGDIDNDGYLDVYLGTGAMAFSHLVPNIMFKNVDGKKFEDVTMSSGTGHLQKGHGISFADYDSDGDLDFFIEAGGAVPGDGAYNILFQNPGAGRHWLKVKLTGTKTNRSALGAKIKAVVVGPDGEKREIHRTVGNNSSFGGNSLTELLGLRDASSVAELEVSWPTSHTTQTFPNVTADQSIEIFEGTEAFRVLPALRVPQGSKSDTN